MHLLFSLARGRDEDSTNAGQRCFDCSKLVRQGIDRCAWGDKLKGFRMLRIQPAVWEDVADRHGTCNDLLRLAPKKVENRRLVEHPDQDILVVQDRQMAKASPLHVIGQISKRIGQFRGFHVFAGYAHGTRVGRVTAQSQLVIRLQSDPIIDAHICLRHFPVK
jgi:hypothetical protein